MRDPRDEAIEKAARAYVEALHSMGYAEAGEIHAKKIRAALAQHAPEDAKAAGVVVAWAVLFDDPRRAPVCFTGAGAETAARDFYASASQSWTCHLMRSDSARPAHDAERVAREACRLAREGEVVIGPATFALTEDEVVARAVAAAMRGGA